MKFTKIKIVLLSLCFSLLVFIYRVDVSIKNSTIFSIPDNPETVNPLEIDDATIYGTFQTSEYLSTNQGVYILNTVITVERVESNDSTKNTSLKFIGENKYSPVNLNYIFENILDDEYYAVFSEIPKQFLNTVNKKKIKISGQIIERCFGYYYLITPGNTNIAHSKLVFCGPTIAYPKEIRLVGYTN